MSAKKSKVAVTGENADERLVRLRKAYVMKIQGDLIKISGASTNEEVKWAQEEAKTISLEVVRLLQVKATSLKKAGESILR